MNLCRLEKGGSRKSGKVPPKNEEKTIKKNRLTSIEKIEVSVEIREGFDGRKKALRIKYQIKYPKTAKKRAPIRCDFLLILTFTISLDF